MSRLVQRVVDRIRDTERCRRFMDERLPCDGLEGCVDCLELVALAVIHAVGLEP